MRRIASSFWIATPLALLGGCSVLLDFDECTSDDHCDAGLSCVDARCVEQQPAELVVTESITVDTIWDSSDEVVLDGVIFVAPGATLTIRSGTTVRGREGSALVVESGARLLARGTEFEPIVFTSAKPVGMRLPGDWGGVALLGRAPTNVAGPVLEGIEQTDQAGFGGADSQWSCGVLEFVRIEFAGYALEQDAELNGLTLAGCGAGTLVSHVQVHYGLDDGVEVFGGSVHLSNVVVSRAQDDGLDWDLGWTGAGQFLVVQQDDQGDNGIEASNQKDEQDAQPRSAPRLWNVSLVGSGAGGSQRALTLKEGSGGTLANLLVIGHPIEAIDVRDAATVAQVQAGGFALEHALMFDVGVDGMHYFPTVEEETELMPEDERDDDEGFDEGAFFTADSRVVLGMDPGLPLAHDPTMPSWVPGAIAGEVATDPPPALFDGFDEQARYVGAFQPGVTPWTANWTAFPLN
ncbi:MAG: hypothetical protein IAG13_32035 [Deltaproteobacteria bacterium]|nr:hypothetical protein [Nannocystaceae bacterium]